MYMLDFICLSLRSVRYTHLRAHTTLRYLVSRLLLDKNTLNQHAEQGKELVHMYQDVQGKGCNQGVMVIMIFKYR